MTDKVAVITGASGGIGAALAEHLAHDGYRLILGARREKELRNVADKIGLVAIPIVMDATHREDMDKLRDAALKEFGQIDVWINNAGRGITSEVVDLTEEDLDAIFDINFKSVFYGIKSVVPYFQERNTGHLINISSFLGRVPMVSTRSAYNAAKAAVNSLTANLRMNLALTHPDIHVSLVMPGVVSTDFARNALHAKPLAPGSFGPTALAQTADDVAKVIVSLINNPVPEVYTNPTSAGIAKNYYNDIAAFEEGMRIRHSQSR